MAKLNSVVAGGIADVSTEYPVASEGSYRVRIDNVELVKTKAQPPRPMFVVTTSIQDEEDEATGKRIKGILMRDSFVLEDKDGKPNEISLRQFKIIVRDTLGEDAANDPDFDSDQLIGWEGLAQVTVDDSYIPQGQTEPRLQNRVKRYVAG